MATGIPSRKKSKTNTEAALAYKGKATRDEIFASSPAILHRARALHNSHSSLIWSENLGALLTLARDDSICGNVRLVYIDPPFATQSVFQTRRSQHAYEDTLTGPDYIEFLRKRLVVLHELLAPNGSLYLHLDDKMAFAMKIVLDEIFGSSNYRNCIVRKKCNPKNYTRHAFGNNVDYLLFYTKTDEFVWNRQYEPWTEERAREYQYVDEATGRRFMKVPVHAPGTRNGETGKAWRGRLPPPGKHWQYPPRVLDEMDARGELYWSANGNPRRKLFFDESAGIPVQDLWLDFKDAHNQNIHITGYPTEKNPKLLARIIAASSNPGDLVLDAFSGSGTTLVAAEALGRKWIGIDESQTAIETTLRRFAVGTQAMGDFVGVRASTNARSDRHRPIEEFSFLVAPEHAPLSAEVLSNWRSCIIRSTTIGG